MVFKKQGKREFSDRGPKRSFERAGRPPERRSYGRSGEGPELFDVTCAQCGKETQVPFKPTGERPVLCRDCFKGGDSGSRESRPRESKGNSDSTQLREINEKLDKIMEALDIE